MATPVQLRRLAVTLACLGILASTQLTLRVARAAGAGGGLAVTTVDPAGTTLVGACFELWTVRSDGTLGKVVEGSTRCDQPRSPDGKIGPQDGQADGSTAWSNLEPGSYIVRERQAPSGYELAPDTTLTITAGAVSPLRLVHRPTAGLTLHKVDGAGKPLPGACFSLTGQGERFAPVSACDGPRPAGAVPPGDGVADGILVFTDLTPEGKSATYTLRELVAPPGYTAAPDATVIVAPGRVTEGTVANGMGGTATTGGTDGGKPIIGLVLEIDSTITFDKIQSFPADDKNSHTSASGAISLEGDAAAGWHGSGNLTATTEVSASLSCATVRIEGEGTYDWTVFDVRAGPSVSADAITVDMDAGTTQETPDTAVFDNCGTSSENPINTWENYFFQVYSPDYYKTRGYRVDHWKAVGGPEAWTAGGVIAEATWTGSCPPLFGTQACTADTTFRLSAVVTGHRRQRNPPRRARSSRRCRSRAKDRGLRRPIHRPRHRQDRSAGEDRPRRDACRQDPDAVRQDGAGRCVQAR